MFQASKLTIVGILFSFLAITSQIQANDNFDFIEGIHYKKLDKTVDISPYKKQVTEIFFYGCPHCYYLEPSLHKWLKTKPKDVNFIQMPAVLNSPNWIFMARVYYTAVALGIEKKFHPAYFKAIQGDKQQIFTLDELAYFVKDMGVTSKEYKQMFKSFQVAQMVQKAKAKTDIFKAEGVPAVVINGKYLTDVTMATSRKKLWELVNYLSNK